MAKERFVRESIVDLPKNVVWRALLDPEILAQIIEGCEGIVLDLDNRYRINARYRLGPMTRAFKGTVMVTHLRPYETFRFRRGSYDPFRGPGAFSGTVNLNGNAASTHISFEADYEISSTARQIIKLFSTQAGENNLDQMLEKFAKAATEKYGTAVPD